MYRRSDGMGGGGATGGGKGFRKVLRSRRKAMKTDGPKAVKAYGKGLAAIGIGAAAVHVDEIIRKRKEAMRLKGK